MSVFSRWSTNLFESAFELNSENITDLARKADILPSSTMCDLGCGDGKVTKRVREALHISDVEVVEVYEPHAELARAQGFQVVNADLNATLPLKTESFDLVMSNQVIEHLYDTELFIEECARIVKRGGVVIVSTENASSWHNIAALTLGWQAFSLTNVSSKVAGIGNPLAIHRGGEGWVFPMQHHRVFSLVGLCELGRVNGLEPIGIRGAGYHPLPPAVGRLDPRHAHFIAVAFRKPAR